MKLYRILIAGNNAAVLNEGASAIAAVRFVEIDVHSNAVSDSIFICLEHTQKSISV